METETEVLRLTSNRNGMDERSIKMLKVKKRVIRCLIVLILVLVAAFSFFPLFIMILTALKE